MHKWIMFVMVTAASLLSVYLLMFGMPEKPVDEASLMPEGVTFMKVEAKSDFTFNEEVFTAKVGDTVRMKLEDRTGIHGIAIDELEIDLNKNNPETEVVFTEPGEYTIYCNIPCGPGHITMTAKLVIEAADAA